MRYKIAQGDLIQIKDKDMPQTKNIFRIVFALLIIFGIAFCFYLRPTWLGYAIAIAGTILELASWLLPLWPPRRRVVLATRKEYDIRLNCREEIYKEKIRLVKEANSDIRFMTPTCSWGAVSCGLRIFEELVQEMHKAINRGIEIKILCDVWDWHRAWFAMALVEAGVKVKHNAQSGIFFRYFMVKDDTELIETGTKKEYIMEYLRRSVRPMEANGRVTNDPDEVKRHLKEFDDIWSKLQDDSIQRRIDEFFVRECPHCKKKMQISFEAIDINLRPIMVSLPPP